jgi:hypothetical protein
MQQELLHPMQHTQPMGLIERAVQDLLKRRDASLEVCGAHSHFSFLCFSFFLLFSAFLSLFLSSMPFHHDFLTDGLLPSAPSLHHHRRLVSYVELYNDQVYDLLAEDPEATHIKIGGTTTTLADAGKGKGKSFNGTGSTGRKSTRGRSRSPQRDVGKKKTAGKLQIREHRTMGPYVPYFSSRPFFFLALLLVYLNCRSESIAHGAVRAFVSIILFCPFF